MVASTQLIKKVTEDVQSIPLCFSNNVWAYKKKVIGVLDMEHTRVNYFNEDHQRTIVTLAAQIAIAIENIRPQR